MNIHYKILTTAILFSALTACNSSSKPEAEAETATSEAPAGKPSDEVSLNKQQYDIAEIQLGTVEMRNLSNVIKANGKLDVPPSSIVSVSAPLGGYLKSAGLLPGQAVRKGQSIAVLENPDFIDIQQDYLEAKSRLEYLSLEYKRQEQLRKEDISAAKTFQQVSSEYKMINARISGLQQKLSLIGINPNSLKAGNISKTSRLYSPINGYVTASNVNTGKYVSPTDVLFELADKSELHLALTVFQKDVDKIKVGQSLRFSLANETDYNRLAKVFLIGKATGNEGTIPVHCHLENPSQYSNLLPGMYAKALIETTSEKMSSVPTEAIVQSEAKDFVFIQTSSDADKYNFKMVPVKKGVEENGYTQVSLPSSFDMKSQIVIKGAYSVLSAMKNVEEE
jgi:membrane fusion protein, heavy metal efflux system